MDEKVLFQYRVSDDPNAKKSDWIFYVFLIVSLLILFLGFITPEDIGGFVPIVVGAVSTIISALLIYLNYDAGKCSITVTATRVYGHTSWRDINLPIDSITSVSKVKANKNVSSLQLATSSGQIIFGIFTPSKFDEVFQLLNNQLAERNNNKGNVTVVNSTSNADELKKFKDLLDAGILTQEEFDAKKKQLLGL